VAVSVEILFNKLPF